MKEENIVVGVTVLIIFVLLFCFSYITNNPPWCDGVPELKFNGSFGDIEYYRNCGNCGCPVVFDLNGSYSSKNMGCAC